MYVGVGGFVVLANWLGCTRSWLHKIRSYSIYCTILFILTFYKNKIKLGVVPMPSANRSTRITAGPIISRVY